MFFKAENKLTRINRYCDCEYTLEQVRILAPRPTILSPKSSLCCAMSEKSRLCLPLHKSWIRTCWSIQTAHR